MKLVKNEEGIYSLQVGDNFLVMEGYGNELVIAAYHDALACAESTGEVIGDGVYFDVSREDAIDLAFALLGMVDLLRADEIDHLRSAIRIVEPGSTAVLKPAAAGRAAINDALAKARAEQIGSKAPVKPEFRNPPF